MLDKKKCQQFVLKLNAFVLRKPNKNETIKVIFKNKSDYQSTNKPIFISSFSARKQPIKLIETIEYFFVGI